MHSMSAQPLRAGLWRHKVAAAIKTTRSVVCTAADTFILAQHEVLEQEYAATETFSNLHQTDTQNQRFCVRLMGS